MLKFWLVFLIVAAASWSSRVNAGNPKWTPLVCRDKVFLPEMPVMAKLGACADPKVYGPGKKHPNCGSMCQADVFGLLDKSGKFNTKTIADWVDAAFPEQHKATAKAHFKDCYEKFGKTIDYKDPECKMADTYMKCMWGAVPKMTC